MHIYQHLQNSSPLVITHPFPVTNLHQASLTFPERATMMDHHITCDHMMTTSNNNSNTIETPDRAFATITMSTKYAFFL